MGGDGTAAHLLLNLCGQLADQSQVPRDPAYAFVHSASQLLLAQPLAAQRRQQPALLQLGELLRAALAAVQEQGIALLKVPQRGADNVRAQALQAA